MLDWNFLINLLDSASMHRDTHLGDIVDRYTHVYLMTVHDIAFFYFSKNAKKTGPSFQKQKFKRFHKVEIIYAILTSISLNSSSVEAF